MKRIVSFLFMLLVMLSLSACDDFNEETLSSDVSEKYLDNDASIDSQIGETKISTNVELTGNAENDNSQSDIVFGSYEQDGNLTNGSEPIEWIKLTECDDYVLLVSKKILNYKEFNDTVQATATNWKNCTLRVWLNETFYNDAFTDEEKGYIKLMDIQDGGVNTQDYVSIMSYDMAWSYFDSNYSRKAEATVYAEANKKYAENSYWLIDSYSSELYKYLVSPDGDNQNNPRVNESEGIRPIIWVKYDVFSKENE